MMAFKYLASEALQSVSYENSKVSSLRDAIQLRDRADPKAWMAIFFRSTNAYLEHSKFVATDVSNDRS